MLYYNKIIPEVISSEIALFFLKLANQAIHILVFNIHRSILVVEKKFFPAPFEDLDYILIKTLSKI